MLPANPAAARTLTKETARAAVERYEAQESTAQYGYTVDRCRVGARRAKCRVREWGTTDELPWADGPATAYEGEFTAVVRSAHGRLVVHLAGICDRHDKSPACDY